MELASLIAKCLANSDMRLKLGVQAKIDMRSRRWPNVGNEVVDRLETFLHFNTPQ